MLNNEDVVSILNDLSQTCEDGEKGFKEAAKGLQDAEIRALFLQLGEEREELATELQEEVSRLGGKAEETGTVAGSVHRGWINLKSAITGKNDAAIIAEAERGEDIAKNNYEKALKANLPPDTRQLVENQYERVCASHDQVRDLERATSTNS